MSGRYERVNTHGQEDDGPETPTTPVPRLPHPTPNSPPPSFHSRTSSITSRERRERVDSTLADAFDADGDDSDDDEPDDRQRLVRGNSFPVNGATPPSGATSDDGDSARPAAPERQVTQFPQAGGSGPHARIYGSGIQSDGVFSNLSAKPERGVAEKDELPPTYEQAAADAAPPYWETTILAPGLGGPDEVYLDGMPVGSIFSFIFNAVISMIFIGGFLLTYLLHSTHAARAGSLTGLGVILIQYGFELKNGDSSSGAAGMDPNAGNGGNGYSTPSDPNSHDFDPGNVAGGGDGGGGGGMGISGSEWFAYILMILGWFILIRGVSDYLRARRHEQLVLLSPDRGLGIPIIAEGERAETVV